MKEVFHGRSTFVEKTPLVKEHYTVNIEEISGLVAEIRIKMNLVMQGQWGRTDKRYVKAA